MYVIFKFDKEFVFILIIFLIISFIETILFENQDIFNNYLLIDSFPLLLFIFIYGIEKIFSSSYNQSKERLILFQTKKKKIHNKIKIYLYIICILILNFIVYYITPKSFDEYYQINQFIPLIFFFINEKIIFKNEIYSHHILSMIIILIINLYVILILFNKINKISFFIYNILYGYCYSLCLSLVKFINTNYDISVFLIGFLFGLSQLILSINEINSFIDIIKNNFLYCLIMIFNYLIYDYLHFYVLKKYTPIHTKICEFFSLIVYWLYVGNYYISVVLIIIFNIISSMIYLEIIELNFCELNKNLKTKICNRGDYEMSIDSKEVNQSNSSFEQ